MRFRTTLLLAGKTANRSTVAVMGGVFMVGVSAENRAAAGVTAGDEIDVDLALDTAPRELAVPADLAAAIAGDEAAPRFWDGLSYSRKSRFVHSVERAKTPETRQRKIDKSVTDLRDGKA